MKKRTIKKLLGGALILVLGITAYYYITININLQEKEEACFAELTVRLADGTSPDMVFQKDFENLQLYD